MVVFAMVLGRGEMDWSIVSCDGPVIHELLHAHFFTDNDWGETSFHFVDKFLRMVVLPLQWFSILVTWFDILFLVMHPSPSNYWMLIFSPRMIGWKLFSISTFGWLDLPQHSFIFPSYQTLVLQPIDATISLFKSSLIVANLHYGHHFLYSLHRPLLLAPMFQPFTFL